MEYEIYLNDSDLGKLEAGAPVHIVLEDNNRLIIEYDPEPEDL